jgi:hypothetical protein
MAMKTTQGLGWLAAGVLALGLNGFYHDGGLELAHRVADRISARSEAVVAMASERADYLLARAETVSARGETQSCRLNSAVERLQAKFARTQTRVADLESARADKEFARFEAMSDRQRAQMERLEANRARIEEQAVHFRFAAFAPVVKVPKIAEICPRVRVFVPQPNIRVSVPSIQITSGAGPI